MMMMMTKKKKERKILFQFREDIKFETNLGNHNKKHKNIINKHKKIIEKSQKSYRNRTGI